MTVMNVFSALLMLSKRSAMVQALGASPTQCLPLLLLFLLQPSLQATRQERHSRTRLASAEGLHDRVDF